MLPMEGRGLLVEERIPGDAAISGLPDAAGDRAKIISVRLAGYADDGQGAATTERTKQAPLHAGVGFWIDGGSSGRVGGLLRVNSTENQKQEDESRNKKTIKAGRSFHKDLRN